MEKMIEIGGIKCRMKCSAAVPRLYRNAFGEDILISFEELGAYAREKGFGAPLRPQDIRALENLAYIMHKYGDPTQPDSIEEWLEQFPANAVYKANADVLELWNQNNTTTSIAKKNEEK